MDPNAPRRPTILVMHSDPLLRTGLVAALRQQESLQTLDDPVDASGLGGSGIDVVVTDYCHALRLAGDVRQSPGVPAVARLLVLTTNDREADIRRAVEAGVHGYVLLGGSLDDLIEGVTTVANGRRYMCRSAAQRMADSLTRTSLTSRELEVLEFVVAGASNKAIARELHIELATVKSHMQAIMAKLDAGSRTQAAGIAAARGLVEHRVEMTGASIRPRAGVFEIRA
jgi:DNA-binding NarL/FixJ family response regulator